MTSIFKGYRKKIVLLFKTVPVMIGTSLEVVEFVSSDDIFVNKVNNKNLSNKLNKLNINIIN